MLDERSFRGSLQESTRAVASSSAPTKAGPAAKANASGKPHAARKFVTTSDQPIESPGTMPATAPSNGTATPPPQVLASIVALPIAPSAANVPQEKVEEAAGVVAGIAPQVMSLKPNHPGSASSPPVALGAKPAVGFETADSIPSLAVVTTSPISTNIITTAIPGGPGAVFAHINASHGEAAKVPPSFKTTAEPVASAKSAEAPTPHTEAKTLLASPNVLEIGIESGSHGWLRVRAEMGGAGEVTASVLATTASAAESLHKQLPALSAYLATEDVAVSSLVVNATIAGSGTQDTASHSGSTADDAKSFSFSGDADRHGDQQRRHQSSDPEAPFRPAHPGTDTHVRPLSGLRWNLPTALFADNSGSWVSVRV